MTPSSSISKPSIAFVLLALIALVSAGFIANPSPAEALTISQCNGLDNQGDRALTCEYLVTNNLNGSVTSSTVELTACSGFRADPATMVCSTPPPMISPNLVTSVEQCNGSGNLRATVTCNVKVVNNITATVTATPATVNQCDGSGAGGGALPLNCSPYQITTSATVTQCNDSGNGGGATQRVNCSVDPSSTTTSLLSVTVNQCNDSGNGGYGYLYCSAQLTDVITAPAPSPSPSTSVSPTPSTSPSPVAPPPVNPPPPNPPPPNPPPNPTPSSTPTPTPSATATAGPTPDATPTPFTPSPDTTDETIGGDDGELGGAGGGNDGGGLGGAGGGGEATGDGGREGLRGGGLLGGGTGRRAGTDLTGGATSTSQVTHVPEGGANTGGGSTSGIENPRLLLLGFMLLAAAWPALVVRRRTQRADTAPCP